MKNEFAGKTILIGIANYVGLPQRFKENLEFLGFKVIILDQDTRRIPVPMKDSLIHICKKILFKDKTHKPSIRNKIKEETQLEFLEKITEKIDYALFTRPDLFGFNIIKKVKQLSNKTVAYQWDGIDRYPMVKKYFDLFDKFFVFDANDLKTHPKFEFTTNFYFDDLISTESHFEKKSIFFVGSAMKDRLGILNKISLQLKNFGLIPDFLIYNYGKKRLDINYNFKLILEPLSFKDSIFNMYKSEYLLDLHNPAHNGLSFRTFESIGYKKKLITNNSLVKDFDFYHPNNIFVFCGEDFSGLDDFINSPYKTLDENILKKYSFTNWINNVLS
jgi:hypothetical protein